MAGAIEGQPTALDPQNARTTLSVSKLSWLEKFKKDFTLGLKVSFNGVDWPHFMCESSFRWIPDKAQIYIRMAVAVGYTVALLVSWIYNGLNSNAGGFLAFLTNWGVIIGSISLWLLTYTTIVGIQTKCAFEGTPPANVLTESVPSGDEVIPRSLCYPKNGKKRLLLAGICWIAQSVSLGLALIISVMYFLFLTEYSFPLLFTFSHVINSLSLIFIFALSRIPFPFSHFLFIYPIVLLYIAESVIIHITQARVVGQVGYVYEPLNFTKDAVSASLLLVLGGLLGPPLSAVLIYATLGFWKNDPLYYGPSLPSKTQTESTVVEVV